MIDATVNWYELGGALRLDVNTRDVIKSNCNGDVQKCLREMITKRLQSGSPLSWRELCDCLRSPTVRRNDVAEKIERQIGEVKYT